MLLISNEFCRTAEQRALHVGSLNERLRDMATDEFDPTSRQEELRKCDTGNCDTENDDHGSGDICLMVATQQAQELEEKIQRTRQPQHSTSLPSKPWHVP